MTEQPPVTIRLHYEDLYDRDGYLIERDVPYLSGEIDATAELGCFIAYSMELPKQKSHPEFLALAERMVTAGCIRELEKQRAA